MSTSDNFTTVLVRNFSCWVSRKEGVTGAQLSDMMKGIYIGSSITPDSSRHIRLVYQPEVASPTAVYFLRQWESACPLIQAPSRDTVVGFYEGKTVDGAVIGSGAPIFEKTYKAALSEADRPRTDCVDSEGPALPANDYAYDRILQTIAKSESLLRKLILENWKMRNEPITSRSSYRFALRVILTLHEVCRKWSRDDWEQHAMAYRFFDAHQNELNHSDTSWVLFCRKYYDILNQILTDLKRSEFGWMNEFYFQKLGNIKRHFFQEEGLSNMDKVLSILDRVYFVGLEAKRTKLIVMAHTLKGKLHSIVHRQYAATDLWTAECWYDKSVNALTDIKRYESCLLKWLSLEKRAEITTLWENFLK